MKKYLDQLLLQKIVVCFLLFLLCSVKAVNRSDAEDMPPEDYPSFSENLKIPSDTTDIEDYAFYNCSSLTGCLALPSSVKSIGQYAFGNCTGLTGQLIIPNSVISIGERAFAGCVNLTGKLFIPATVTEIGECAFDQCISLAFYVHEGSYAQRWCDENGFFCHLCDITDIEPVESTFVVKNGEMLEDLVHTLPADREDTLVWSSSDERICTVNQDGTIFGCYPGLTTITASSMDGTVSKRMEVLVQANYRALLFSESTFINETIIRNRGDVTLMKNMLASVTGPDGGKYSVDTFDDLKASEVYEKIESLLVAPSREGDVSMFFFASHGDADSSSLQYAGRLWCRNKSTWLELPTLAQRLSYIKGKVIVLLESCGPGAALISYKGTNNEEPELIDNVEFSRRIISAFISADPGMTVYFSKNSSDTGITGKATNLFLTEKFIVMTAASYHETSYSARGKTCNLFPAALTDGVGTSGPMPADKTFGNKDGKLTVNELYQYVYENTKHMQTPMVHPTKCDEVLFLRAE